LGDSALAEAVQMHPIFWKEKPKLNRQLAVNFGEELSPPKNRWCINRVSQAVLSWLLLWTSKEVTILPTKKSP